MSLDLLGHFGIEILDAIDGDAVLEDGGAREPSLASPAGRDDGRELCQQAAAIS